MTLPLGLILGCSVVAASLGSFVHAAECVPGDGTCAVSLDSATEPGAVHLLQTSSKATAFAPAAKDISKHTHAAEQHEQEDRQDTGRHGGRSRKQAHSRSLEAARAGEPAMVDVQNAFNKVLVQGTKMSFYTTSSFPSDGYNDRIPPYSQHFESIIRLQGTPYIAVSGHGPHANLFVVDVASGSSSGLLAASGSNIGSTSDNKPTNPDDKIVAVVDCPSDLTHAGGLGQWGSIVVVPVEEACDAIAASGCPSRSEIFFYDLSNPTSPKILPYQIKRDGDMGPAGAASVVQEADGTFLLMVGRANSYILDFYRSVATSLEVDDPGWTFIGTWDKSALVVGRNMDDNFGRYQNLNMMRQQDGKLFFIGTTRSTPLIGGNWMDLFEMDISAPAAPFQLQVTKVGSRELNTVDNYYDWYAGGSLYPKNATEMYAYGIDWLPYSGVVTFVEFGAGSSCEQNTGGTCYWGSCSSSRNAVCVSSKCMCPEGYCSVGGACVKE